MSIEIAEQQKISRINGHAEMQNGSAGGHNACRNYVTPIGNGRSAEHEQQIGIFAFGFPQSNADRVRRVCNSSLEHERAAERCKTLLERRTILVQQGGLLTG